MARRDGPVDDGAELREYFLRMETAILCTLLGVDWAPSASRQGCLMDQLHRPDQVMPLPSLTSEQLAHPLAGEVLALMAGEAYQLRRSDLPDWHVEHGAGDPNAEFVLGADDRLRLAT